MPTNAVLTNDVETRASVQTLREVVEALAPLEREAGSEGEREAAEWLAARLGRRGSRRGSRRRSSSTGTRACSPGSRRRARSLGCGAQRPRRASAIAGGAATAALIADEASNGLRPVRRALGKRKTTWNVVAEARRPRSRADGGRDGTPRRRSRRGDLRPDRPAQAGRLVPGRDRADRHRGPDLVGARSRARRWGRWARPPGGAGSPPPEPRSRRSAQPPSGTSPAAPSSPAPTTTSAGLRCWSRWRRPSRAAGEGRAGGARIVRGRGGTAGRRLRIRPPPPGAARSRAHLGDQPRLGRLAGAGDARGRGSLGDGGLLRPRSARPVRGHRRPRGDQRCAAGCAPRPAPTR